MTSTLFKTAYLDRFTEPPFASTVNILYALNQTVPQIAADLELDVADVLDCLGAEHFCSDCGRLSDLAAAVTGYSVEGDVEVPSGPVTGVCDGKPGCQAAFLNRRGNEVVDFVPWWAEAGI